MRKSGIGVIGDCAWGTHFCQFYQTPQDLLEILVPYFKAGLENNEACMWITSTSVARQQAESALREAVPGFDRFVGKGQIEILPHSEWYLKGGRFDLQRVLDGWVSRTERAIAQGLEGLRLTGDTIWLEKEDWGSFAEYERSINEVIGNYRMIALCSYSLEKCGVMEILDVVRNHQFALVRNGRGWDVLESSGLRRARESQLETEERYQSLFNSMSEGFALHEVICDAHGKPTDYRFIAVNPAFERLTGLKREKVIGRPVRQVLPEIEPYWIETYGKVAISGQPVRFENYSRDLGKYYEVSAYCPAPGQFAALFSDVTPRKRWDEKLTWLASFPELNPNPVVEVELAAGRAHYINPAASCLFPDLASRGLSHPWLAGVQEVAETLRAGRAAASQREISIDESCYQQSLSLASKEQRVRVYGINITPRRQAEEALREANEALERRVMERTVELREASSYARSLIEVSLDPLVTISPDGKITDVNKATELVTGVDREHLIGSSFSGYFTEPEAANAGYQKVISEGLVRDYPLTIRHESGRTTEVLYNATVYRDEAGRSQGVFAAARDVTELRAAERRRNLTNELLELFAVKKSSQEYLDSVVEAIRAWSGCSALGIRLVNGSQEAPFASCVGFSAEFQLAEAGLSCAEGTCVCIRTIAQSLTEEERAQTTSGGSFYCDDISAFMGRLAAGQRERYVDSCIRCGLASLAVVPIRYGNEVIGAIHLADRKVSQFARATVEFLESMAPMIGEAVHRFRAEAELGRYRDHLEDLVRLRTGELEAANAHLQTEIAERRRVEGSLRSMTEELGRSNRDLEQFAYVASHDLQEPLRAVSGYVQLIQHRYADRLDDKACQYIAGATDGVARMQRLITDLLAFSRVGTRGKNFQQTELKTALDSARISLNTSIQETSAAITADPLPTLRVDPTQIAQLFQNLVSNAIKFCGAAPPRIHVGAKREPGRWLLSVRDNGIGIDPKYAQRIFLIFQRLHTRRKYPGTGVGLAICKRIVERHGGEIWVESQPGEGSTFYFTIPAREENPT